MKGVVLAGGTGSRLFPLTKVTNKHLLPVGRKPMIYYPIEKMLKAGIKDILIVTGLEHMGDIVNLLGSGKDFKCRFTYRVQDEAGGIAQALALAEDYVGQKKCIVILGDNIVEDDIAPYVKSFMAQENGAKVLIKQVEDPERFGVAEISGQKIVSIEEKPELPKSNYAVTGFYMYDNKVFEVIKTLKPSGRGEFEITDVNNAYIKAGTMTFDVLKGYWTDAGTFESLSKANELVSD
ncbi:MAG: sugar phosphate nucleotidyltransferase [Candidatus Margulisiibacteriota bacterium]